MKLALITPYWKSNLGGGINAYSVGLVESLKQLSNIDIEIGYMYGSDKKHYKIPQRLFSSIFGTINTLKKINPDIVQVHNEWPLLLGCAFYKCCNKNVKLIYTPLTEPITPDTLTKRIYRKLRSWIVNWSINKCDHVIIGCEMYWKVFSKHYYLRIDENKIVNISMAISPQTASGIEVKRFVNDFKLSDESIKILVQAFTASKIKANGIKLAIKTLKKFMKKYPKTTLILTRDGAYLDNLKKFAKKEGLEKNVIFTGDVDNGYVPLKVCDIFLWPWLGESGFGLALLEGMYEKKSIVATSVTGILPPLKNMENAIVVEPNEIAIIEAMETLIKDKKLAKELGINARRTVIENYTWDKVGEKFLKLYRN